MSQFGIFDKNLNKFIRTYHAGVMKNFGGKYADPKYLHIQFLGTYAAGHSWDGTNVIYDNNYAPAIKKAYQIYTHLPEKTLYTNSKLPPYDIDYRNGLIDSIYPDRTFDKGELVKVDWYAAYEPSTKEFSIPILTVDIAYIRDSMGFATSRQTTRKWYFDDQTVDSQNVKITYKYYTALDQIREGKTRRGNIVNYVPLIVLQMLITTELPKPGTPYADEAALIVEGRRFLAEHKTDIINFVDDSNPQILTAFTNDTTHWLDNDTGGGVTIRDYLLNEFNIQSV